MSDDKSINDSLIWAPYYYGKVATKDKKPVFPTYGIKWLDETLIGIHQNELVLIGAESGYGKTTLVSHLADHNAGNNMETIFIKLEGDPQEYGELEIFKLAKDYYYEALNSGQCKYIDMNFIKYRLGLMKGTGFEKYEEMALSFLQKAHEKLYLWDIRKKINVSSLYEIYKEKCLTAKLILLDHINYMTVANEQSIYQEETDLMMALKDMAEAYDIPSVVVSHLRKKQGREFYLPDKDDFMGSSNKFKIAYTCIMISQYPELNDYKKNLYATVFRVVKSRGGVSQYRCGIQMFDAINKRYTPMVLNGIVVKGGSEIKFDENELAEFCHLNGISEPEQKKKFGR
jgi:hypothetical protein